MTRPTEAPLAVQRIAKAIALEGIAKTGQNEQDGYAFRTIEDIRSKLAPLLDTHSLIITPTEVERTLSERRTVSGVALFYETVKVRYDFLSTIDNSSVSATVSGTGSDTGDRAMSKALTDAYKSAVTQIFCIATKTEGDAEQKSTTTAASMPAEDRTRHERAILASIDAKTLKSAHSLATAAAVRVGDGAARKAFNEAKKTRTDQLAEQKAATTDKEQKPAEATA